MIYVYQCVGRLCPGHLEGWTHATGRVLDQPARCPRCGEVAALVKMIPRERARTRLPALPRDARERVLSILAGATARP